MVAAYGNNLAAVKELLRNHAKVNARDEDGRTPLMHAAWSATDPDANPAVMSLLLRYGADVYAKDNLNRTALDYTGGPFIEGVRPNPEVVMYFVAQ